MTHNMASQPQRGAPSFDAPGRDWRRHLLTHEFGLLILILVAFALFVLAAPGFGSRFGLYTLGRTVATDVLIGLSMMVVIVTGGLNLAVGAIAVAAVMTGGWLAEGAGLPLVPVMAGALAVGAGLGLLNGWLVVRTGIHSFVITLATMSVIFGTMIFLTRAEAFRELPAAAAAFGKARIAGVISPLLLVMVTVAVALSLLYRRSALGREMLAAGASPAAAEVSGVRVGRAIILCHALSGLVATIAGLLLTARAGAAIPSMAGHLGQDWLLPAFLAPVLGGALLSGGRAAVLGTVLGGTLATLLSAGLLQLQVGEFWVRAALGVLLLLAVLADKARRVWLVRRGLA